MKICGWKSVGTGQRATAVDRSGLGFNYSIVVIWASDSYLSGLITMITNRFYRQPEEHIFRLIRISDRIHRIILSKVSLVI